MLINEQNNAPTAPARRQNALLRLTRPIEVCLTELEVLLLTIIYAPEAIARESWHALQKMGQQVEEVSDETRMFLPLITTRLTELVPDYPALGRLKGQHRYVWTENQVKLKTLAQCLKEFADCGIETLVLNDTAITLCTTSDTAARPINIHWLLVKPEKYEKALSMVREKAIAGVRVCRHLPGNLHETIWRDARSMSIVDHQARVIAPPDLLLMHLLSNQLQESRQSLWFTDAVRILSMVGSKTDQEHFSARVKDACLALPVLKAWSFFQSVGRQISFEPAACDVTRALDTMPIGGKEISKRCVGKLKALI